VIRFISRRPLASNPRVEETQLDFLGVLREEREIHAFAVPRRAARIRTAGPDSGDGCVHALFLFSLPTWVPDRVRRDDESNQLVIPDRARREAFQNLAALKPLDAGSSPA
jgi:hypothetical protein